MDNIARARRDGLLDEIGEGHGWVTAAMGDAVIRKGPADLRVTPNFGEYDATRASFDYDVPDLCAGMGPGLCNIGYAAVDRHADGPAATKTALRFVADAGAGSTAESARPSPPPSPPMTSATPNWAGSPGSSPTCCGVWESARATRFFVIMGRVPELYISMLGALRNGAAWSRHCSRHSVPNRSPPG